MTDQEFRESVLKMLEELNGSIKNLYFQMDSLKETVTLSIKNTEARFEGALNVVQKDFDGLSSRVDTKISGLCEDVSRHTGDIADIYEKNRRIEEKINENAKDISAIKSSLSTIRWLLGLILTALGIYFAYMELFK